MAKKKTTPPEPLEVEVLEAAEAPVVPIVEQPASEVVVSEQQTAALGPIIGGISTETLKQALAMQTEQRELIKQFIQDHLVDGTDYGRIHVVSKEKCRDLAAYKPCNYDGHYSKRVLFKPGQEKLFSLFQITDTLERDEETYEMLQGIKGLVAYKCTLYRGDQIIGHGRGSATVNDKGRDANATIKIAEKRARMDACLSLGFSEYFAQDLEDPDYKAQAEMANERARQEAEREAEKQRTQPMTEEDRTLLAKWMYKRGFESAEQMLEVARLNGVDDPKAMTSGQAQELTKKLGRNVFIAPASDDADTAAAFLDDPLPDDMDLVDYAAQQKPAPSVAEAELVVDNDLKSELHLRYAQCGLNSFGEMWFKKYVTGKPYGGWDDFTDEQWRRAYQLVEDMETGAVEVPDKYIKGLVTGSIKRPGEETGEV